MVLLNPHAKMDVKVWASPNFAWKILKGRMPESLLDHDASPSTHLTELLIGSLPHYNALCGKRWTVSALLREANYIADVAFLSFLA